ncbi:MAG: tRNA uridine-5-carboxymethylaminomethyl(34) synthesis enzyme MnmG [Bacteroidota bacterium]|nr:tRNA uridine-5-carboxymethylaminomethyl(34) synthesis enzyme MnmG [Bacteroidota bacterium]
MFPEYDVIVVGAGHAGCEAAVAAANMGSTVLLVTMNMQTIGQMSCNPAMGGIAKGQIVREIDAMGGYSGLVSDKSAIQFRMLNLSKGPAMWSPRTQNDRMLFAAVWREMLENTPRLDMWQEMVSGLMVSDSGKVYGVVTQMGTEIRAKSVVLTNGTFLNGTIHIGEKQMGGGRAGERGATGITEQLNSLGFDSGRMKTGTPPRIDGRSLNYDMMEEQAGDLVPSKFSYLPQSLALSKQRSCYVTYTNADVHDVLRTGFEQSPMFTGRIKGLGPRYCPSIEDKIDRFAERDRHQIFVEPEGWNTVEVYVNGFSTSLAQDVQQKALRLIPGFENAKMFRPGYAIEYDYFPPTQLLPSLETKLITGLFFAGQINGTTGYEEAGAQGLMAGINAHQLVNEKEAVVLRRDQAYIGVLIDDLVNKGTDEPYRMFTSRAEYRILLRQDNADLRLTELAFQIGLADEDRYKLMLNKRVGITKLSQQIKDCKLEPADVNEYLSAIPSPQLNQKSPLLPILSRPEINMKDLITAVDKVAELANSYDRDTIMGAEIALKYAHYIDRERELAHKMKRLEDINLHHNFDYNSLKSMGTEAKEKLSRIKPINLGQASRISGINPSDIAIIMVHLGR